MEVAGPPEDVNTLAIREIKDSLEGIKAALKELVLQVADIKRGQLLAEGRILTLELEADAALRRPQSPQVGQPLQAVQPHQPTPSPSQSWAFVAAKAKAPKRPAEVQAPPVFNPFAPLETISEEKKVRKLNPPSRTLPVMVAATPGPSKTSPPPPPPPPGAPGPSGRKTNPKGGPASTPKVSNATGPTPGPKASKSGPGKGQKKIASTDPAIVAPKVIAKKGKAKAAPKFRDVAQATSSSCPRVSQAPSTSSEVVPQVVSLLPQVPQVNQMPPTSEEEELQVSTQVPQVPQVEETMDLDTISSDNSQISLPASFSAVNENNNNVNGPPGPNGVVPAARSRVPPIVIRDDSKWIAVTKAMAERRLNFSKAKTCSDGIRVQPVTVEDFRGTTRLLDSMRVSYHTYTLNENKTLRVVLRPVPIGVSSQEILDNLKVQGFEPIQVTRMVRGRKPMPLVLVEVPARKKDIFAMKTICNLVVKVEKQLKPDAAPQCHGCQRFYHCARNCRAQVRCVKCAGNHVTRDCPKESSTPAKCANCGGVHTANYRGCPVFPKGKGNGKAQSRPKAKPAAAKAKPDPKSRKTASSQPTTRQEEDLKLKRTQLQLSIAAAKDPQSLKQALLGFIALL